MPDVIIEKQPLSLALKRIIEAPRKTVWRCWTEPELLKQWYCPKPWRVTHIDQDFRVGGRNNGVMEGPNGERVDWQGVFLEVEPEKRLTFTDAFTEGFVPTPAPFMTGIVVLEDASDDQTHMTWSSRHATEETAKKHLEMGFEAGWTAASEQLNELAKQLS